MKETEKKNVHVHTVRIMNIILKQISLRYDLQSKALPKQKPVSWKVIIIIKIVDRQIY